MRDLRCELLGHPNGNREDHAPPHVANTHAAADELFVLLDLQIECEQLSLLLGFIRIRERVAAEIKERPIMTDKVKEIAGHSPAPNAIPALYRALVEIPAASNDRIDHPW